MKRYIPLFLGLAVLGLFIFGCDAIVDQEPIHPTFTDIEGNVGKMVPFKGSGTWEAVDFLFPYPEGVMEMYVVVEFEGTATHLGRFEAVWKGRYTFIVVDDFPVPTDYLSSSTIYTAANGDELYDKGCVNDGTEYFPEEDGLSFFMTGIRIEGGTGRFENAVGSYELTCIATVGFPSPGGTGEFEGVISRPGR